MALSPGSHLGPYEILDSLGAGGMGEVYRARDTRLDRSVAVKVLPATFAEDPSFLERFEREAKVVSSLNHPHICSLYDVGEQAGVRFLVMELLEGETLAFRLTRGPLPLDEALRTAVQIADALSRAHRQGIVHRDLKPANIMLTRQGAKLLDFGLARIDAAAPGSTALTLPPTQERALTHAGTILGTFQYMAPEQLEGREADARTDIFGFGAVLYEMVTGRKAFAGSSQASLIASIMSGAPAPISAVQPMAPPALDRVVRVCLAKDPDDRWQTAQDLAAELKWIAEGGSQVGAPVAVVSRRRVRERLAWLAAAVCAIIALAAGARLLTRPDPPQLEPTRFSILSPRGVTLAWPRFSPDGRTVAFVGADSQGTTSIWVRPLGSLDVVRLEGTEGVLRPFWSPDSRYLAYFAGGRLKKVLATGGPSQLLCEHPNGADGSWSPAGVILFDGRASDPIYRVSDSGGVPAVAMQADATQKEVGTGWPFFLPDGRHYLFVANGPRGPVTLKVGGLDRQDSAVLMPIESRIEYASGHIFYVSQQTLMARPFSAGTQRFTGDAFPVTDRMQMQNLGRADFSLSPGGHLTFMTDAQQPVSRLLWLDRAGRELSTVGPPGMYRELALAPDDSRLAVVIDGARTGSSYDVWVMDLKRGAMSRLTFGKDMEGWPVWSPDGNHVAYAAGVGGLPPAVHRKLASGAGADETVYGVKDLISVPLDWSPDGRQLLIQSITTSVDNADLLVVPSTASEQATPFIQTPAPFAEGPARFSPDGRWIVYQSTESNRPEIYVQPFPPSGGKWQISTAGGEWPVWRADGREIFYVGPGETLYAVSIDNAGGALAIGEPVKLFQRRLNRIGLGARGRWLVSRDGQRFLLNVPVEEPDVKGVQVILDWANGLRK